MEITGSGLLFLPVATLQNFLEEVSAQMPEMRLDYVHGDDVVKKLVVADGGSTVGFMVPKMEKDDLFPTVLQDGALPRKTFSMGHAEDKRFYLEGRRIVP